MLTIHNIRVGFATNSSSTHSMAFLPNASDSDVDGNSFGWNEFVAASSEAKARWLAQHLIAKGDESIGEDVTNVLLKHWLGVDVDREGYVDHQSLINFPSSWGGKGIDVSFFEDFRAFVMQEGLVVLGGNDNEDDRGMSGEVDYRRALYPIVDAGHRNGVVARKDNGFWTIFDPKDGTKFRVAFRGRGIENPAPEKSNAPELIDVKITDKCFMDCAFCYQGSTKAGNHADMGALYSVFEYCRKNRVFEVALGGGEPLLHPEFVQILRGFAGAGTVPNFTTRNTAWLREPATVRAVLEHAGGWAFSTEKADTLEKLHALCLAADIPADKMPSIQYIIGVGDRYGFERVVDACKKFGLRLTLLGSKTTGRGGSQDWKDYDWISPLKNSHVRFGIDTALVQKYGAALKAAGVPEWCYTEHEGRFSMYIDAVAKSIGPSSYGGPESMIPVKNFYHIGDTIAEHYPKW